MNYGTNFVLFGMNLGGMGTSSLQVKSTMIRLYKSVANMDLIRIFASWPFSLRTRKGIMCGIERVTRYGR